MNHLTDCLFCKITKGEIPDTRVYEDDVVFAMMDIFPESKGHLLIIPKNHADNLFDCDVQILAHIVQVSQRLAKATKTALKADGIKILCSTITCTLFPPMKMWHLNAMQGSLLTVVYYRSKLN